MWGVELVVMAVMVLFNSVFAAYEIALASISVARLKVLVNEHRPGAAAALYMKENMEASLAVVQLGITLVGAIAAATGGAGAEEMIAPWLEDRFGWSGGLAEFTAIALVVLPLTVVTIMFGELVPKVYALRNADWVCLRLSPTMRWFGVAVWPAVWLFEGGVTLIMEWGQQRQPAAAAKTEAAELQELRAVANLARASRLIGAREEKIILNAARLGTRPVREIMLPAEHIGMLAADDSIHDSLIAAHLDLHTRFPVAERKGDSQSIVGYVNFKDLVAHLRLNPHEAKLPAITRAIPSLRADLPINAALEQLIREHSHIALMRDATGQVVGMITLEDILEELVGEIEDEFDRLPSHVLPSGHSWVVGGGASLVRLREQTGIDLSADAAQARTLNDWVVARLGRPVRGGEVIERDGVRIAVRKVRRQKVLEAQVTRQREPVAQVSGQAS